MPSAASRTLVRQQLVDRICKEQVTGYSTERWRRTKWPMCDTTDTPLLLALHTVTLAGGPDLAARAALPFGLAATVGGYLIGEQVPKELQGVLHPVVVTALVANAGAALHGELMGWSYTKAQQVYLAKVRAALSPAGVGTGTGSCCA